MRFSFCRCLCVVFSQKEELADEGAERARRQMLVEDADHELTDELFGGVGGTYT